MDVNEMLNDRPTTEWKCEVCGAVNRTWTVSISWLMQKGGEKYRHGYCESCKEKEDREELLKIERQQQDAMKRKTESLYKRAEIPDNIKSALLDKMVIRKGSEDAFAAMKNLRMDKRWVYLHGDNSVGKSFLIGATINSLIAHHVPVLYVNESQLFDRIRFTWDKHSTEKESDIFNLFKQASVIFWDEFLLFNFLDRESPLWKYERMYSFIEYCSEHSKIMVFASNIKPSSNPDNEYGNITDRAGKRIVARLKRHDIKCIKMSNAPFC